MTSCQTYLTLDQSQKIVLSDLPFKEGTKLAINIQEVKGSESSLPLNSDAIPDFNSLLDSTQGIWTKGDGLDYQQKIREEWS